MFCDEPTSGLDSFMAQNIVQVINLVAYLIKMFYPFSTDL